MKKILVLLIMIFLAAVAKGDYTNGANGTDETNGTNGANGANGANGTNGTNGVELTPVRNVHEADLEIESRDLTKRVYIYGGFNFHFSENMPNARVAGRHHNIMAGIGGRFTDNMRIELAFEMLDDTWEEVGRAQGYFGFANILFDARLARPYRRHGTNPFMPFVGFGFGGGMFDMGGLNAGTGRGIVPAYNLIGGISLDLNRTVQLVLSYKYIQVLSTSLRWQSQEEIEIAPNVYDIIYHDHYMSNFAPISHNVGLSVRMNF